MRKGPTIGCAIMTHCAKQHLPHCLAPLLRSSLKPRILVVNSSSGDGTLEAARTHNVETLLIPRQAYNHGTSRELARQHLNTDLLVMLTPDAYLAAPESLELLLKPLLFKQAESAYARQIPHRKAANFFESFPRAFNYGETSHSRSLQDASKYGVYTFFCSNACAAYSNAALDEVGGFQPTLFGEDTLAIAQMLRKGMRVAYVAEALVHHSHAYSLKEEFLRHFDIGFARKQHAALLECGRGVNQRGWDYARQMFKRLIAEAPHLLPYACAHLAAKWTGYQIGKRSLKAPLWWKKALSSQDFYWTKGN
jgi:rhamnosyltransferase